MNKLEKIQQTIDDLKQLEQSETITQAAKYLEEYLKYKAPSYVYYKQASEEIKNKRRKDALKRYHETKQLKCSIK